MNKIAQKSPLFNDAHKRIVVQSPSVIVKAGTVFEIPLIILKSNTLVSWSYKTEAYDIKFGISKPVGKGEREYLVENKVYKPDTQHHGKAIFPTVGNYVLVWDNTYSWRREKVLQYQVEICLPEPTIEDLVDCSRSIVQEIVALDGSKSSLTEKASAAKAEEHRIHQLKQEKMSKLEELKREIQDLDENIRKCEEIEQSCKEEHNKADTEIQNLRTAGPFYVEGIRIFNYLPASDLLRLSCVNKTLNKIVHEEVVWARVLSRTDDPSIEVCLTNAWVQQKWKLQHKDVATDPAPKEKV